MFLNNINNNNENINKNDFKYVSHFEPKIKSLAVFI
jgi:hypothetical protein